MPGLVTEAMIVVALDNAPDFHYDGDCEYECSCDHNHDCDCVSVKRYLQGMPRQGIDVARKA